MIRRPPRSPLFPYPPLSRSRACVRSDGRATPSSLPVTAAGRWPRGRGTARGPAGTRRRRSRASPRPAPGRKRTARSEEHTSELQSRLHLVCRLLLEKKKIIEQHSIDVFLSQILIYYLLSLATFMPSGVLTSAWSSCTIPIHRTVAYCARTLPRRATVVITRAGLVRCSTCAG